jgi:hypothetical protein
MDTYVRGKTSFQATLMNIADKNGEQMFCSRENGVKKGEHQFCEAVKVDASKTKETNFQASITNTIALVKVLFEDVGVASEIIEMAKIEKKSEVPFPSGHSILFNKTFEFEKGKFFEDLINVHQKEGLK